MRGFGDLGFESFLLIVVVVDACYWRSLLAALCGDSGAAGFDWG